ncbi:MAG: hypothetical protein WEB00_10530 [Dehalococcoidia bacterium]
MSTAHPPRPFDVVALTALLAGRSPNEAVNWLLPPGAVATQELMERFVGLHLPLARTRSAIALVTEKARIRALAAGRSRATNAGWEVDTLFAPEPAAAGDALDCLAGLAASKGARRIFLRLSMESRVLEAARTAGFIPYATENLMMSPAAAAPGDRPQLQLRVASGADAHGLFRLYNRAVPQNVRAVEALTLEEWAATQNPIGARSPAQFVAEADGEIVAWVRSAQRGSAATFDALVDPAAAGLVADLASAVSALLRGGAVRAFVPSYMETFAMELERRGFERGAEFVLLARQLARPIGELSRVKVAEEAAWIT